MLYIGVVENNVDEMKLGRCQVRIFGKHTDNREIFPTEDLPWAQCIFNGPNISEQCDFKVPTNGDFVAISFLDAEEQFPLILGSVPKKLISLPNFDLGFSDPNQEYPDNNHLDESGISRLARNEKITDTIIQDKKDNKKSSVDCGVVSFDEPETPYDTVYPYNRVINTKHHVIELDDTSGKERIHIYHKSGTSTEMHPNGDKVELIKAKKFLIIESDKNSYIGGNFNIHINGNENKKIVGEQNEDVDTKNIIAATDIVLQAGGNITIDAGGNVEVIAGGDATVDATGNAEVTAGGNVGITASGPVQIQGAVIQLN